MSPLESPSPHSAKFRIVTGLLSGVALAALVIAVAVATGSSGSASSGAWSSWSPTGSGQAAASEIAQHVAPYYRLSLTQQLDIVTLIKLASPSAQGSGGGSGSGLTVAVDTDPGAGSSASSLSLLGGSTVAYDICGTGSGRCQLPGTASTARMLLLRREALELALYTFKYVPGTENVICVLPPGHTQQTSTLSPTPPGPGSGSAARKLVTVAVLFQRQELEPWLEQPLSRTLTQYPPLLSELALWQKTEEAGLVDEITAHGLFSEQTEAQQVGGNLLVLSQLPPQ